MAALVSIGVPVYRGTAFVAEALRSIQAQSYRDLDVVISVDGGDAESAEACEAFLADSRFRMVVQPRQLGWARNIGTLMAECRGDYWYYHQQDDIVTPDYVACLIDYLAAHAPAAVAYCDIETFGTLSLTLSQSSVTGSASLRQLTLLTDHHPAVAFRGLTRRAAIDQSGGVRENEVESFSADTTWMASIARAGELHRVPRLLYFKRYHDAQVHTRWQTWPLERRMQAWQVHCRDMFLEAAKAEVSSMDRQLMWAAALARLVSRRTAAGYLPVTELRAEDVHAMLDGFLLRCDVRRAEIESALDSSWATIVGWSRPFFAAALRTE